MGIVLLVDGGLASQLNKYLIGQFLEKKFQVKVKYDTSWFQKGGKSVDGKDTRNFDLLKIFPNIDFQIAAPQVVQFYKDNYYYTNKFPFIYDEELTKKNLPLYIDGYFSHWRYLEDFDFSNLEFDIKLNNVNAENLKLIEQESSSVAVHIRRGDYVGSAHDVITADYYIYAITYMQTLLQGKSPKFFIFSTEMKWVEENVLSRLPEEIKYQSFSNNVNSDGVYDFYLISKCKHQVCANSTFSYYAALLNKNQNKTVIIPEIWMKNDAEGTNINNNKAFRYPGWIVISNNGCIIEGENRKYLYSYKENKISKNKKPKVSVLCPSYNHEKYVGYFIESVLNQSEQDFELIIVDDCSKDNTVAEIEKFKDPRIKLIKHEYNKGINSSLNTAFRASKGGICVFIASDDIMGADFLKISSDYLMKNPSIGVFYSSLSIIDENNMPVADPQNVYVRSNCDRFDLLNQMFFKGNVGLLSPGMVMRRKALEKLIPLSASMFQFQDYQMHIKLLTNNEIYQTTKKLVNYRIAQDKLSASSFSKTVIKRCEIEEIKIMDTYLEIKDLDLLKKVFKSEIQSVGEPVAEIIPYFLGVMAFHSQNEIRKNWGFTTIMNFLEKEENMDLLHKKYNIDFKSYIDLVNVLDLENTFANHQNLIKLSQECIKQIKKLQQLNLI